MSNLQTLLKIKVLTITVLLTTLLVQTSQAQSDSIRVTLDVQNMPMKDFVTELEHQTHASFYYKDEWMKDKKVQFTCQNMPLKSVIENAIVPRGFEYRLINNQLIVILPENEVKLALMQLNPIGSRGVEAGTIVVGNIRQAGLKPTATLKGKIIAGNTGESVAGAIIKIEDTNLATVTDENGAYSFQLKPGVYKLNITSISFEPSVYAIQVLSDGTCNLELFEQSHSLNEVAVYANRTDKNVSRNQMSMVELDAKGIKNLAPISGEKDIIKSMTRLPGIQSVGEFGSGINVRGGGEDQNLYLVDEAPLFNTSHVFGLMSVLNPDAIKSVALYKGHIPAEYGERVSSVMDIKVANNQINKTNVVGGIGIYSSRLMVKTPLVKNKVAMQMGGRMSYSDWMLQKMPDYNLRNSSANFYDMNASVTGDFEKDKLALTFYASHDNFKYVDDFKYNYGNQLGSFNWTHMFSPVLTSHFTAAISHYGVDKDSTSQTYYQSRTTSGITYGKLKADFTYTGIRNNTVHMGLQALDYQIQPGKLTPLNDSSLVAPATLQEEHGREYALYLNDAIRITDNFSMQAGLRVSAFYKLGAQTVNIYEDGSAKSTATIIDTKQYGENEVVKSYFALEPRLSLMYRLNDNSSVKASYNRNVQNMFLISSSSVSTPDNIWKLADEYFKPLVADQFALGYYHNWYNNIIEFSAELYYKKLRNMPDFKTDGIIAMNPHLETDLTSTDGNNYGLELYVKKSSGKLEGSLGYTYSRSLRQTNSPYAEDQINGNSLYPSAYDKPHDLNLDAVYNVTRRFRFGANFNISTGRPVTLPEYKYYTGRDWVVYYSDRNEYRLPTYHRLDLSMTLDESLRRKKAWKGSWTFSIMNVYARKNPYSVFYSKSGTGTTANGQLYSLQKLYFIGKPFPTITYNFIF